MEEKSEGAEGLKKKKALKGEEAPSPPLGFFPGELPPEADPSTFTPLPARVWKKITVDKQCGCWEWTGSVMAHRSRYKAYRTPIDYKGHRNFSGCHQDERAVPMVWQSDMKGASGKGYSVGAARYIYARLTGLDYSNVPIFKRCPNDLCVSPYHVRCDGIPPKERMALSEAKQFGGLSFESEVTQTEKPTGFQEDMLETLKKHRPAEWSPYSDIQWAEEECSLPSGSISEETWNAYAAWAHENPEEEEA